MCDVIWCDDCDHGLTLNDDEGVVVATRRAVSPKFCLMGSQAPVTHAHDQSIEQRDRQKQRVTKQCEWCDMMWWLWWWSGDGWRWGLVVVVVVVARRMTKILPFRYSGDHNRLCKETFKSKERQERDTRQCEWWNAPYWWLRLWWLWMMRELCWCCEAIRGPQTSTR